MPYEILYAAEVARQDIPELPNTMKGRISRAIEERLGSEPLSYGLPLRGSLKGLWKLRVGDYRVVFKPSDEQIWILVIQHRSQVYDTAESRKGPATN